MQLEVGDVLFLHGTSATSRGIEWFEGLAYNQAAAQFSHVALYAGGGQLLEAQGFRRHAVDIRSVTEYPVVSVKRAILTQADQYALILAAMKEMHDGYDYPEIAVLLMRYLWHLKIAYQSSKRVECAELVIRCYESIGIHLSDDSSPAGLWMSPELADVGSHATRGLIAA